VIVIGNTDQEAQAIAEGEPAAAGIPCFVEGSVVRSVQMRSQDFAAEDLEDPSVGGSDRKAYDPIPLSVSGDESQPIDALRRANVSVEILHLGLDLFETLLDNVADANDSAECSALDYRQVSDALERHHIHQINQPILGEARLDLTGHQLIDGKC
jgi:hypothetical protein